MDEERAGRWCEWMAAAQRGDAASYEKLLREMLPVLRGFVLRRLRDPVVTEDVVQNVFVSIHRFRHTYRSERPVEPWMFAIARNAVIDYARSRTRRLQREESLDSDGVPEPAQSPVVDPFDDGSLSPELAQALEGLPDKQREAVELIQLQGLSVAEAAMRAGVTKTALKVRAHRGYRALRTSLDADDFGLGSREGGKHG